MRETQRETERARELLIQLTDAAKEMGDNTPCSNAPDLFFPDPDDAIGMKAIMSAKKMCQECPLINLCAEYGIEANEEFGIWGGFTASERRSIRYRYHSRSRASA